MMKDKIRVMVPVHAPDLNLEFGNVREADKARAILYVFYGKKQQLSNENFWPTLSRDGGWFPVTAVELKFVAGNDYQSHVEKLIQLGVIERKDKPNGGKSYVPNSLSMLYRVVFGPKVTAKDRKYRPEYITNKIRVRRLLDFFKKDYKLQRAKFLSKNRWFGDNLRFMEKMYLSPAAVNYAEDEGGKRSDQLLGVISQFNAGTHRFISVDAFAGRYHHHLGMINRELRRFLRLKGSDEYLLQADVKSAQPYLIGSILYKPELLQQLPEFAAVKPILEKYSNKPDVRLFFEDAANGVLYDKLMKLTGLSKPEVKLFFFRDVFFSAADNHNKRQEIREQRMKNRMLFRSLYPSVYDALTDLKRIRKEDLPLVYELTSRNGKRGRMYATPAMLAQRLETRLFLHGVTRQLTVKEVVVGTIHDAWIMKQSDLDGFMEVYNQVFQDLDIKAPQLTVEVLKTDDNIIAPEK